ncbi:hypothetical protein [Streptomyces sp. NBC_00829]|uniref:hypothetical protein n=1 Tax=Streptomyces sp. NBC_00829 TaxID=2903679 RepID=UPI003870841F|nr:hypothetical protein OG293_04530 [Streptomyces sp. NBC_00829]
MTPQQPDLPLGKAAFDHRPTALGHQHLVIKRWCWLTLALGLAVASLYLIASQPLSEAIGFILICLLFHPVMMCATFLALRRTSRVAAILKTYAWRAFPCEYPRRTGESPKVILINFADGHMPVFRFTPFSVSLAQKRNPQPDMIWFAGDPRYGGVVSPVGGHFPVRVVPESMGDAVPEGTPEDNTLAERAELIKGCKVHTT